MAPRILPVLSEKDITRFHSKVQKKNKKQCWVWTACQLKDGYGAFKVQGYTYPSNRICWLIYFGFFDPKKHVCHDCDNPNCCNPNHLFLGTHNDNMQDKVSKGRQSKGDTHGMRLHPECQNPPVGERSATAKLTNRKISEIRTFFSVGVSQAKLAKKYRVDQSCISRIVNRKRWKHI